MCSSDLSSTIRLHRYLVVEDCGVVINPMVVDGQVRGGVTQGVAAALLERVCFDPDGQPVSTTLMDYLAPTAAELCPIEIVHLQTPSRFSETGAKGMGEGGTIGAPAAVLNAINDALSDTDVRFDHIPVLPPEVSAALAVKEPEARLRTPTPSACGSTGATTSWSSSPAGPWPTCCGTTWATPAPTWAASTASAARARSCSTASRPGPA